MEGHLGHLTERQQAALTEFKQLARGLLTENYHDDYFCLRWLRARNFNVEAAKAMLEKSLHFRKSWRLDHILEEFKINKGLQKIYPGGILGFDKLGGCVMIYPMANMQPKYFLEFTRRTDVVKVVLHRMERALLLLREQRAKTGRNVEANTIIFDLSDFDITTNLSTAAFSIYRDLVSTYELNYPESLSHAFVINAPPIFSLFFNLLKPLLNGTTLSKVQIFGKDPSKWKPVLLDAIDADQLPVRYGGTRTGRNGDEGCEDEITYVDKLNNEVVQQMIRLIPEADRLIKACVGRRSVHDHVVLIEEANSALKVEFESDGHDIAFAILRRASAKDSEKIVLENKRYNSHQASALICIRCPAPSEYILRFDNTFSALRSKSIAFNLQIIPAAKVNDDMLMIHEP
ncbi:SEC14-like protein 2 [Galendromus occidentalis]|uniref:SEC14-like protein 2 n=1 Tax=Galendromus occidentalis TaxID=34638 RepID=A0AAJ6VZF9_9ACAR|nr:SEC14-like protein 2 [Galendromus occidentalis]